jgi:hypothetical protein
VNSKRKRLQDRKGKKKIIIIMKKRTNPLQGHTEIYFGGPSSSQFIIFLLLLQIKSTA